MCLVPGHKVLVGSIPTGAIRQFSDAIPDSIARRGIEIGIPVGFHGAGKGGAVYTPVIIETSLVQADIFGLIAFVYNKLGPFDLSPVICEVHVPPPSERFHGSMRCNLLFGNGSAAQCIFVGQFGKPMSSGFV